MAQIIPIRDLKNTAFISEKCSSSDEPIFITKNGYGDMVIMNIEVYNKLLAEVNICKELKSAEVDIQNGDTAVPALEFIQGLKNKYGKL